MTTDHDHDASLLARFARSGDEAAFAELVRRHGPMVAGVCRRILSGPSDADDAMQAVFLTLARKASTMLSHPDLAGWLHRCATNIARRQRDAERTRRAYERAAPPPAPVPAALVDPEVARLLDEAISALPADERDALVLHHLEGRTQAEIARAVGAPPGTIAWRLHRARERLATLLARRGVSTPAVVAAVAAAHAGADHVVPALASAAAAASAVRAGGTPDVAPRAWRWASEAVRPAWPAIVGALAATLVLGSAAVRLVALGPATRQSGDAAAAAAAVHDRDQSPTADATPATAPLDATECYRRAVAALPARVAGEGEWEDARRVAAGSPEALRWFRRGAELGPYRRTSVLDGPDLVLAELPRVTAAACAMLGDGIDADAPDAIAQATSIARAGAGLCEGGAGDAAGFLCLSQLTTTLGAHIDRVTPARAAQWLEAMNRWPDADPAAAAPAVVAAAHARVRALAEGDAIGNLATYLGRERADAAMVAAMMERGVGEQVAAIEAEDVGETGAVDEAWAAARASRDAVVAAGRLDDERRAVALIIDLAGIDATGGDARSAAEHAVRERGAALFEPWGDAIEHAIAEDVAAMAGHPPADAFQATSTKRWDALIERVPLAGHDMLPVYGFAESLRGQMAILRAAFTAGATGRALSDVGATWPAPYGPLQAGADRLVEASRRFATQPIALQLGWAPAAGDAAAVQ